MSLQTDTKESQRKGIYNPAEFLIAALQMNYHACGANSGLSEKEYVGMILTKNMDYIFDILASCPPCAPLIDAIRIDEIEIDDIPLQLILEAIRQKAEGIFTIKNVKPTVVS